MREDAGGVARPGQVGERGDVQVVAGGSATPSRSRGAPFLLLAGLVHVRKPGKSAQESLATWTDLVVGVAVLALAVDTLLRG